jgi:hypothetical protein
LEARGGGGAQRRKPPHRLAHWQHNRHSCVFVVSLVSLLAVFVKLWLACLILIQYFFRGHDTEPAAPISVVVLSQGCARPGWGGGGGAREV